MRQLLVITLFTCLIPCLAISAEIYRWTDESGNTHYSENPPQGVDAKPMNIQTRSPEPGNKTDSQPQDGTGTDNNDKSGTEGDERDSEAVAEAKRENCKAAREALKMLEENARVQVEEDGERRYLSPEEMEAERQRYEEIRDENCE